MRNKWFLSAFVIALAILGISLEQKDVPNQEILITFSTSQKGPNTTHDAIALVTSKLQSTGASNIKVEDLLDGTLKLSYHSKLDVSQIQNIFNEIIENKSYTSSCKNSFPTEKSTIYYELDIYKIQYSSDFDGPVGHIIESKSETTRATSFDNYAFISKQKAKEKNLYKAKTKAVHLYTALVIKNLQYKIPEVRAGPIS
ncbi:hypothetical protein [Dokdonia sp. Hel_I_53]|uniref:hypothetical protein n=1 Tax=Dokdonia sp. Hel_I_53 TaxID=1566287 RepID=UPI00119B6EAE|nr:hypothetical protein [Dokdonia sp. Hel_I_53]TVZ51951.1 hypothetical protein OD90_1113 [Dokdonia sp. Hel_I_53]